MPRDDAGLEIEADAGNIRDQIMAAMSASDRSDPPDEPEAREPEAEPERPQRRRDAEGRFAKGDDEPEAHAEPTAEETTATSEPEEKPAEPEKPKAADAPAHWSEADKTAFKNAPPDVQAAWLRRDKEMTADYTRKTQDIADLRRDYDPVRAMLTPYMDQIRAAGMTPATLIQNWHNAELALMSGPDRAIPLVANLVRTYKLDPHAIARALGVSVATPERGVTQPAPVDAPAHVALPPEVQQRLDLLERTANESAQFTRQMQQQRIAEQQNRVMNTITEFREAKDQSGALLHPHYDELEEDMIALLTAERARGIEPTLADLYSKAVWANPSTRQKLLDAQTAALEAQRKAEQDRAAAEARAKAANAKKAASPVTGAPGSGQAAMRQRAEPARSLRETLLAAMDDVDAA